MKRLIAIAVLILAVVLLLLYPLARAKAQEQEHKHPGEIITGDVARFYDTWMRPDLPTSSCCNQKDCYATPARMAGGKVMALHRESGDWIEVPEAKIERGRDARVSPDGRNHLCASPAKSVFCFVWGGGT